jgi:hypothetical protein
MPFSQRAYKVLAIASTTGLAVLAYTTYDLYQSQHDLNKTQAAETRARDEKIRQTAIQNCRTVGEPLLRAQIHGTKSEIRNTRDALRDAKSVNLADVARRLGVSRVSLERNRDRQRDTIRTDQAILRPLVTAPSCVERYPPLNG